MTGFQIALRGLRRGSLLVLASLAVTALIVMVLLLVAGKVAMRNQPTAGDHEAMVKVLGQARDPALFDGKGPGGPTITGKPHPRRVELQVFGLIAPAVQDRVLARLQGPRDRPVLVHFYQQPPEMLPDPHGGGFFAGPVKLLREVALDRNLAAQPLKPGGTSASPAA